MDSTSVPQQQEKEQARLPLQFTCRSKSGIETYSLFSATELVKEPELSDANGIAYEYSKDGSLLAVITNSGKLLLKHTETGKLLHTIQSTNSISAISFSAGNKYILTWEKPTTTSTENLIIWSTHTGQPVSKLSQKQFIQENWPSIQWSNDDLVAARAITNEIQFYAGDKVSDENPPEHRLQLPNVSPIFTLSPTNSTDLKIAVFVPEKKGSPGSVNIVQFPSMQILSSKSFFKAQEAELLWNSTGTAVLAQTHTDVDKSGKSYYGESGLCFLQSDGKFKSNIILKKEGPVHSCSWSPSGKEFLVIYGYMPAQATIFNLKCEPLIDFGEAARNTAKWSPSGKLICIAGFGNLQGHMDFWDRKKVKKIGSTQSHYTSHYEWSPDSSYLLTCVLFPRMRVGNEFKIWSKDGAIIYHKPVSDELYQMSWKPVAPHLLRQLAAPIKATPNSPSVAAEAPKPVGKYIPPHASGSAASAFRREQQGPTVYKKDNKPTPQTVQKPKPKELPPGYDPEDEPKKGRKKKPKQKLPGANQPPTKSPEVVKVQEPEQLDPQKKIKLVTKKLRQIEELKQQQQNGKVLDKEQLDKIATEDKLRAELENLGLE